MLLKPQKDIIKNCNFEVYGEIKTLTIPTTSKLHIYPKNIRY